MPATGDYVRPTHIDQALEALNSGDFTVAAGCTDLFPATERKVLPGRVLDITAIAGLRGFRRDAAGLWIGATTTWRDIIKASLPPAFDGLKLAAREVGAQQIQNRGTVGGNLCNASPAADGVPPLLTLDAEVELSSAMGTRTMPLHHFLQGPRDTKRDPTELLTRIFVPNSALVGQGAFHKLGARKYLVISIAMCAARIEILDGLVHAAALAVGACGPVATRLPDVENAMIGLPLSAVEISDCVVAGMLSPIDDVRADAPYRRLAAAEVLRETLDAVIAQTTGAA